jgi:sigma-B regulation protein RsbU (phosphoserine phosphatase)
VGGDYFDFFELPAQRLGIAIADVSGKGIPAALLVSTLHAALHADIEQRAERLQEDDARDLELGSLASKLNRRVFSASTKNKFITFYFMVYDRHSGALQAVNAGHNYPVLVRADGRVERPREGGFFLGMFESAQYSPIDLNLAEGDLICLFTDGISEARSASGEEFGEERLIDLLVRQRSAAARETVDAIYSELAEFTAGEPQYDDMTLVLLRAGGAV